MAATGALLNIDVPDLAQAEDFYIAAFGLHFGRRFDGWTELLGLPVPDPVQGGRL